MDPALQEGKYFPKPNDYDTEHDFYWYILNDASGKLPGMGGVYNSGNLDVYRYALHNPIKVTDPDGQAAFFWHFVITYSVARDMGIGFVNSLKLAWYAMMWDFREGSQRKDRWDMVNSHAMVGYNKINNETQEISEELQGADNFITSRLNTAELKTMLTNQGERNESSIFGGLRQSPLQDVGEATHTAVDKATKVHAGQPWKEFTLEHLIGDIFLSNSEIREAKQNVRDVLTRAIEMGILRREEDER